MMPDRSSAQRAMELHERLSAFLLASMPLEPADLIATALTYELTSLLASAAETEAEAIAALRLACKVAEKQIRAFGVGRPHP